jgi:hypothetical protein
MRPSAIPFAPAHLSRAAMLKSGRLSPLQYALPARRLEWREDLGVRCSRVTFLRPWQGHSTGHGLFEPDRDSTKSR